MIRRHLIFVLPGLCSILLFGCVQSQPVDTDLRVVLIRHAEKPKVGFNLSCQGMNRAKALPAVLYSKFGLPSLIYVPSFTESDTTRHARMYQTIVPFADKYHLSLNSRYKETEVAGVARAILRQHGTVLVVWEHKGLDDIAEELGVRDAPNWKSGDFDTIWIITFNKKGKARLTIDQEGLHPSSDCN